MTRKDIAIIGSGISGLTCAYTLAPHNNIRVFEAADYIGGHTHTVRVEKDGEVSDIDTGFIVFNDRTYPNFIKLMDELGVKYQPTEMSFSVKNDDIDLEYNGNNLNSLFAQRRNLLRPRFWSMVLEIVRFNKEVRKAASDGDTRTIGQFLEAAGYSEMFKENYLLPMISAIWSMGLASCMDFPLRFFVSFFDNHGLLDITNRPQWYSIKGGSSSYIKPLTAGFVGRISLNSPVLGVERSDNKVQVRTADETTVFDEVIFACHGNQALALLDRPSAEERSVLQEFQTSRNDVVLHTDISFLPRRKLGWASWNYNLVDAAQEQTTLTYNMNILQRLQKRHTYLVTLNQEIATEHILRRFTYHHPIFTLGSIKAQQQWQDISGKNNSHFCGAYWFNGFHEDGVKSALRVCSTLEAKS
ncbi:NAD(P)/FAD-dependent oxidoreductase [Desulfocastanea catecholica]